MSSMVLDRIMFKRAGMSSTASRLESDRCIIFKIGSWSLVSVFNCSLQLFSANMSAAEKSDTPKDLLAIVKAGKRSKNFVKRVPVACF